MKGNSFFSKTVTVYNRMETKTGEYWQAVVLTGVCWQEESAQRAGTGTVPSAIETGTGKLYIPFLVESGRKAYCPPELFDKLGGKTAVWTLRPGDMVCRGEKTLDSEGSPLRTMAGESGYTITAVAVHDVPGRMAHWEVTVR